MRDIVDDIKAKLDIVDVVKDYVELRKAGRNLKGLSPFKKENTPSFVVSPDKQLAYCFATQKGGDMFAFIMEVENVDFRGAIEHLAQKAGLDISSYTLGNRGNSGSNKEVLYAICAHAAEYYASAGSMEIAKQYLSKRGLKSETIEQFGIGYAGDSIDGLFRVLTQAHHYLPDDIVKAGLASKHEGRYYDKFKKRLMFPIHNALKQIVGFAGRVLDTGEPKYLNSPETAIYDKGSLLYGLHLAKDAIKEKGYVILVEGYMDVITAVQAGVPNIVATSGTALTEKQISILKRSTDRVYFLFDQDAAGFSATVRNGELCLREDVRVHVLDLQPYGVKDVDEFFQTHTSEEFEQVIVHAQAFVPSIMSRYITQMGADTLEKKLAIVKYLTPHLRSIANMIEQDEYIKLVATTLSLEYPTVKSEVLRKKDRMPIKKPQHSQEPQFTIVEHILGILLQFPELYIQHREMIARLRDTTDFERYLKHHIQSEYDVAQASPSPLLQHREGQFKERLEMLLLYVDEHNMASDVTSATKALLHKLKQYYVQEMAEITKHMKTYQREANAVEWKRSYEQLLAMQALVRDASL